MGDWGGGQDCSRRPAEVVCLGNDWVTYTFASGSQSPAFGVSKKRGLSKHW